MKSCDFNPKQKQTGRRVAHIAFASLAALIAASDLTDAARLRHEQSVAMRPGGEPIMAIVSLRDQQITVYDDKGWIMRAPVSSGQKGRETPAGIFSIIQKRPSTTPICMTTPSCLTCSASLGRASRFTADLCQDILHRTAASGCRTTLPDGCSA